MIYIEERITEKVPGITSLFVKFNYNPAIVELVKVCAGANYNKDTKEWELPLTNLSKLIDGLCGFDSIDLKLLPDKPEKEVDWSYPLMEYKTKPYAYQEEGIRYGLSNDKFMLLDVPGLGKSLQAIYLAEEHKRRDGIEHCLIICGVNTLKTNWKSEILQHSNLSCKILGERVTKTGRVRVGSVAERLEDLKNPIEEFFVITNIETLRNPDIVKELTRGKANMFDMIIVDEVHCCFSADTRVLTTVGEVAISDIVDNPSGYNVYCADLDTNTLVTRPVLSGIQLRSLKSLVELVITDSNGKEHVVKCTEDHEFYTQNRGWVKAGELSQDDDISEFDYF